MYGDVTIYSADIAHIHSGDTVIANDDPDASLLQKVFDNWVLKNINVRECYKFVKKKDDDDPV